MSDHLDFELVSPVKKLLGKPVAMVTIPGAEGDFGVLPGHAPLMTTLRPGVIETYNGDQIADRIFVAGGFAEVTAERCTVLAQEATPVADLHRPRIEETIRQLTADLAAAEAEPKRAAIGQQLAIAQAKLEAATTAAH